MNGLAVSVASRSGLCAAAVADLARNAEAAGLDAFFVAERCADSLALAHSALLATERITVGTAIANAGIRHPVLTAMSAATLAEESGGRFVLGLGVANAALNQDMLGLAATRPLQYMREYVGVVRSVLSGHEGPPPGDYFAVSGFVPDRAPAAQVPLFIAGLQPRMLALAGEVGDGVFLNLMTTEQLPVACSQIDIGLDLAGRTRADIVIACLLPCCISADPEAAARAARQVVAGYAMHPAAGRLFATSGFGAELLAIRDRLTSGDPDAAASVTDEMVDALVVHGTPDVLPERIKAYRDAGADLPVLFPMPVDHGWADAITSVISAAEQSRTAPPAVPSPNRKEAQHV